MRYCFTVFCFLLFGISTKAQTDNKIVLGTIDSVNSKLLKEKRKIWVHVPNSTSPTIFSKQRYPVIYLLDGDAHFYSVVGMMQQLSSVNGNTICPEMIVVGIPNTDRTRDLTPTHVDSDLPFMDSSFSKNSGGGEKFISFIEKELIPHIDSLYPTEPYRMLIGHSFGGLIVMQTLINHKNLFNSYVAIDPSMWYDHEKFLNQSKQALKNQTYPNKSLFLGIANTMNPGMDTLAVQKDTSATTRHIRSILDLSKFIRLNKQNQLNYQYSYYRDDTHGSVPLITEYDALRFIFKNYPLKLTITDYMNINTAVINKIEKHYSTLSTQFGYKIKVPESMINSLGYQTLGEKKYETAEYLFKLNIANYPTSYNVYDSMGDFYETKGDKTKAIDNYKKALSIQDVADTRKKLTKLQGK